MPDHLPWASIATCKAVVPEDVATTKRLPQLTANFSSSLAIHSPWAIISEFMTSKTACFSDSPKYGLEIATIFGSPLHINS